jgi:outer membrane protein OmpA-like peptidoglycan-associated protein
MEIRIKLFLGIILGAWTLGASAQQQSKCDKHRDKAYEEFQMQDYKKAAKTIKKAIKCSPNDAQYHQLSAAINETLGDIPAAIKAHEASIIAEPMDQANYYYFASYLYRIEKYERCLNVIEDYYAALISEGFNPKQHAAKAPIPEKIERLKTGATLSLKDSKLMANLNIQNMGPQINSANSEYWPGMSLDGSTFVFTRLVNQQEDFYFSYRQNQEWSKAVPAPGRINTLENEGTSAVYMNADKQWLFYTVCNQGGFGSCDLFYSELNGNKWGPRNNMGQVINTEFWDAQPSISADGNTLVFSSARRKGSQGDKDLWMAKRIQGVWQEPVNLGPKINTSKSEQAPFLHYDGRTLYFASDGHQGFGEHDLFVVRMNEAGEWGVPENLGLGINTQTNDVGFYVDALGNKAYFASMRAGGFGGMDIYSMDLPDYFKPLPVNYVLGKVIDKETRQAIKAKVRLIDVNNDHVWFQDSVSEFLIPIVPNKNYALLTEAGGYLFDSKNFQPLPSTDGKPYEVLAELQRYKDNQVVRLNNIFFDVDKFDLKPESFTELQEVIRVLVQNPQMVIEISGHTDNTGSAAHNIELSKNRAASVITYLVGKGIERKRLSSVGFGSSQAAETNETPEGRALNRRIEMKILKVNK